ncbi:MFS transporter [Streptomyces graminilatus]|uniref:MFS transporter n=1 Tax=Streptomyces graminilatus TaxID=1464070 RepID=UPI0006E3C84E|nr:MFS transporter [Streptomyces graminilatus]
MSEESTGSRALRLSATYRGLVSVPGGGRLAAASLLSKLPINMFSVSTVLLLSPRYSYSAAGLAVSAMLVANAVSSPLRGRSADRYPVRTVLAVCLAGYLAGTAGLMAAVAGRLPLGLVVASVAMIGLCFPPVSILLRGYWVAVAGERMRVPANSLESALMDVTLITGPVSATWLSTSASPFAPFMVTSVLMALAVTVLPSPRGTSGAARTDAGDWLRPLRSRPLLCVLAAMFLFCAALSTIEVVLPVYAQQHHVVGYSGWFLGGLSVGSIVGALVLGAVPSPPRLMLPALLGVFVAGACLLGFAMTVGPVLVLVVCPLTGLAIGSSFGHLYTAVGTMGPSGCENETQGWATSCSTAGFAAGAAAGAAVADVAGAPAFLLLTPATAVAAALFVLGGIRAGTAPTAPALPQPSSDESELRS